jgi:serine/threonine protein kinase
VIREHANFKLIAYYGFGPDIIDTKDDDIICYQDCMTFSMEYCYSIEQLIYRLKLNQEQLMEKFRQETKDCLLGMHNLHIIYRDIKPSNIMYSPSKKRYILNDFGISQTIDEGYLK